MAFKLIIPGADFSALGNPKVEDYIEGLPGTNLSALYLFDQGMVGQDYAGPAVDYSGNKRDAALIGASVAKKTAGGVGSAVDGDTTTQTPGFGVFTPVVVSRKWTIFGVFRNRLPMAVPAAGGGTQYIMPWALSGNFTQTTAPTLTDTNRGQYNPSGTRGILGLNSQNPPGSTDNRLEMGMLNRKLNAAGDPWARTQAGASVRPGVALSTSVASKADWIAFAVAFDADSGAVNFRSLGQTVSLADPDTASAMVTAHAAAGSRHMFGAMSYSGGGAIIGDMAMAGVYDGVAKSVADLDVLIAAMKTRLASRIPVIY